MTYAKKSQVITQTYFGNTQPASSIVYKNLRSQSSSNLNRISHLRSKQLLDSTSKEESLMDAEKSLSKLEFHQILERYKAKAMKHTKPTELTLIPENVSAKLDASTM